MRDLKLTREPLYYDEYDQPCFVVKQEMGLSEFQDNHLIANALADGYTASVAKELFGLVKDEVERAGSNTDLKLLEIGGGDGNFFDRVKNIVQTYINIDPGMIDPSKAELERIETPGYKRIKCSAECIPLPDESVDVIISIASLDHVPDFEKALSEVRRLLRPGGVFILTLNNRRSWWKIALSGTSYLKRREQAIAKEHYFQWSYKECYVQLSKILSVEDSRTVTFIPFVPRIWRYLLPLTGFVGQKLFPKYGGNIVAMCIKREGSD